MTGIKARPDFGADPRAVGVLPLAVKKFTGDGRKKAGAHVGFAHAVFVPVRFYKRQPVFAKRFCVYVLGSNFVHASEPRKLKIKVVVGQRRAFFVGKALDVKDILHALIRRSDGAANIFSDPAAQNFVS